MSNKNLVNKIKNSAYKIGKSALYTTAIPIVAGLSYFATPATSYAQSNSNKSQMETEIVKGDNPGRTFYIDTKAFSEEIYKEEDNSKPKEVKNPSFNEMLDKVLNEMDKMKKDLSKDSALAQRKNLEYAKKKKSSVVRNRDRSHDQRYSITSMYSSDGSSWGKVAAEFPISSTKKRGYHLGPFLTYRLSGDQEKITDTEITKREQELIGGSGDSGTYKNRTDEITTDLERQYGPGGGLRLTRSIDDVLGTSPFDFFIEAGAIYVTEKETKTGKSTISIERNEEILDSGEITNSLPTEKNRKFIPIIEAGIRGYPLYLLSPINKDVFVEGSVKYIFDEDEKNNLLFGVGAGFEF